MKKYDKIMNKKIILVKYYSFPSVVLMVLVGVVFTYLNFIAFS